MAQIVKGTVGAVLLSDGNGPDSGIRMGQMGDVIVSDLHGRFFEQVYRGNVYSIGTAAVTALSANTITLTNTSTPIIGVWNPSISSVNLVILQAMLQCFPNTFTSPVGPGAFFWASSTANPSISTGSAPFNRKTLSSTGSQAKGFPGGVALTGLTTTPLVIFEGADFSSPTAISFGTVATTSLAPTYGGVQNFDGSLIIPPGGVLSLVNSTSTTTFSTSARLMWEEVPIK